VSERALTVPAADGYPLAATLYGPDGAAAPDRSARSTGSAGSTGSTAPGGSTAVVLSSLGGDRRRYMPFARHLARRGWNVLTFDYRGIGGSRRRPVRGFPASLSDWGARDVEGVLAWAARHAAGRWGVQIACAPPSGDDAARTGQRSPRLVVVGHSVGGQILPLASSHRRLDAVLLVAPQAGWWRLREGIWAHLVRAYFTLTPAVVGVFGGLPLWPTGPERVPAGVALEWRRWCLEPTYRSLAGTPLGARFAEVTAPVLAYSFADDPLFSPRRAVEALLDLYAGAPVAHRHVHPRELGHRRIGHRGFFDPAVGRDLWPDAVAFLEGAAQPAARAPRRPRPLHQAPAPRAASPSSDKAAPAPIPSGR